MHPNPSTRLLALLLATLSVGIALGAGGAYHEFTGTVEAAADDGTPIIIEGRYYSITEIAPPTGNLTAYIDKEEEKP